MDDEMVKFYVKTEPHFLIIFVLVTSNNSQHFLFWPELWIGLIQGVINFFFII